MESKYHVHVANFVIIYLTNENVSNVPMLVGVHNMHFNGIAVHFD